MITTRINNVIVNWMTRRTIPGDSIKLIHRNCYIFPNRYGFLFLALLIIMLVGATNYQNNLAYTLTFLLCSMGIISIFLTFRNLVGITVKCGAAEPVFVGDDIVFSIYLSTEQRDHFAVGVGIEGVIQQYVDVAITKAAQVLVREKAEKRGCMRLGRVYMASKFPLGMLRCWTWIPLKLEGLVYPQPIEPKVYMNTNHIDEEAGSELKSGSDDFDQIRDYQKGDSLKHVHWKAFAREKGLYTKQFSESVGESSMVEWHDFDTQDVELKLSYICYLVLAADKAQRKVGIGLPNQRIEPDLGKGHIEKCLKALALYGQ